MRFPLYRPRLVTWRSGLLCAPLLLVIWMGVSSYRNLQTFKKRVAASDQITQLIANSTDLFSQLLDAESGIIYEENRAPSPLAAEDTTGCVVYLGSFAKTLFPQLSLAYIHAPAALITHLSEWHLTPEHSPDPLLESAVADLFLEGEVHRHLGRLRTASLTRRDLLTSALQTSLGKVLTIRPPALGMSFWLPVAPDVNLDAWTERSIRKGVAFTKGREYAFDGGKVQAIRFGFASHREEELLVIVHRMAQAL